MTYDEAALRIMLNDKLSAGQRQTALTALAKQAKAALDGGDCPNCGHGGPHEDNGHSGASLTFCCTKCGEQWDAIDAA